MEYFPGLREMSTICNASRAGVGTVAELHRTFHDGRDMTLEDMDAYAQVMSIFASEVRHR